jgi:hypothetical protein
VTDNNVTRTEREVGPDDTRASTLEALAGGPLWVLVKMDMTDNEETGKVDLSLQVETGSWVTDTETLKGILRRTLEAL